MLVALLLTATTTPAPPVTTMGDLHVEVRNITSTKGDIWIAVFDRADTFLDDGAQAHGKIYKVTKTGSGTFKLPDVPYGRYALSVFHDENGNGKLDKNFWGVPKEPFGFSEGAKAKYSKPAFGDADFEFGAGTGKVVVTLREWKDQ